MKVKPEEIARLKSEYLRRMNEAADAVGNQAQIARDMPMDGGSLYRKLAGNGRFFVDQLLQFAIAVEADPAYLLTGGEDVSSLLLRHTDSADTLAPTPAAQEVLGLESETAAMPERLKATAHLLMYVTGRYAHHRVAICEAVERLLREIDDRRGRIDPKKSGSGVAR